MTTTNEQYVSVAVAAAILQVSPSTLWRWIGQGYLPAYRMGHRRVLLKHDDLDRMIVPLEKGHVVTKASNERAAPTALGAADQRRGLAAVARLRDKHQAMLRDRGGSPFSSAADDLHEMRDARDRELA